MENNDCGIFFSHFLSKRDRFENDPRGNRMKHARLFYKSQLTFTEGKNKVQEFPRRDFHILLDIMKNSFNLNVHNMRYHLLKLLNGNCYAE